MHVTRVELENIKAYEHAEFDFEPGTTAIVGSNGAGKTTILEAIAWALFDSLEYSKDDFLRRGAKKGWVRVTFASDLDERQYTVYRDTGNGYYISDPVLGVRLAEKKRDVADLINKHLGVEPGTDLKALFRSAIGVPQGLFTAAFLQPSVQRKAAFDRLLKVEEYREGAEKLLSTVRLIDERISEARERIAGAEGQLARYDALVGERADAETRERELSERLAAAEHERDVRSNLVAELDEAEQLVIEARARCERLAIERTNLERRLADAESEFEAAQRAQARQQATESDYQNHTAALADLRLLETERASRDRVRTELERNARLVLAADLKVKATEDALEAAECARAALAALLPAIEAQESLERERERLRDLRAGMVAASEGMVRLERELQILRQQHKATNERLRLAESARGAQKRVDDLESERIETENQLALMREAVMNHKHLTERRGEVTNEVTRLRNITATLASDIRQLEANARYAFSLAELETHEQQIAERAAHLRAEITRDERMREEVQGGVCPILIERCLNIGVGRTFDDYFTESLAANKLALRDVETERTRLSEDLRRAREAATTLVQLARLNDQLAAESGLLASREATLVRIDEELAALSKSGMAGVPSRAREQELKNKMIGIDSSLIAAREELLRCAELEPLRVRLREIEAEGKRRKEEYAELKAVASGIDTLDSEIKEAETRLKELNDPRGRSLSLSKEADREAGLQVELQAARTHAGELHERAAQLESELARYADLDLRLSQTIQQRDSTADGYREYLASAALAATLPTRQSAIEKLNDEVKEIKAKVEQAQAAYESQSTSYDRDRHAEERTRLQLARDQVAFLTAELRAACERLGALNIEIQSLEVVRLALQDEISEKERLERLRETTDFVRDTLKQAGPLVTESYLYNISIEANQLFRDITGEAGRALRWTRDYEVMLEENGHERSFLNLSGGEQMVAALSIRLALLKQLSDIRLAIFDEPTINMDAERRERLAHAIGQVRHFDQLFVISHDDTFEETADHVIEVGRRKAEGGRREQEEVGLLA